MAELRKSIIKKRIRRNINTAQFEQLEISCEFEEEVEWESIDQRQAKSEKITNLLIMDFQRTLTKAMEELGLNRKPVSAHKTE
jgi:hypothetical protein